MMALFMCRPVAWLLVLIALVNLLEHATSISHDCPLPLGDADARRSMGSADLRAWMMRAGPAAGFSSQTIRLAEQHDLDGAAMATVSQEALVSVLGMPLGAAARLQRCFQRASTQNPSQQLKNFGYGLSQGHIHTKEETLYEYNVSDPASMGVITHWWITGGSYSEFIARACAQAFCFHSTIIPFTAVLPSTVCGNDTASCDTQPGAPQENGGWNPFIDFVIFRYYIDGEEEASIEFSPNMACGVGPFANRTSSSPTPVNPAVGPHAHDVQAGGRPAAGEPMGAPQAHAPWSALYFGKGSADGGWYTDG